MGAGEMVREEAGEGTGPGPTAPYSQRRFGLCPKSMKRGRREECRGGDLLTIVSGDHPGSSVARAREACKDTGRLAGRPCRNQPSCFS